MSTKRYWWSEFGSFHAKDAEERYPNPGEVVLHYRLLKKMTGRDLAQKLGISPSMACHMEKESIGLDSVSRCRELVLLLQIPAFLLGLDSLYHSSEEYSFWWQTEGYPPFDTGEDGYPLIGQVIKHYRELKLQQSQQSRHLFSGEERWTQYGLAVALEVSEFTVRKMENNHKGLDSISRRQALAFLLDIPPVLLGLDSIVHSSPAELELPQTILLAKPREVSLTANAFTKYRQQQEQLWIEYFTHDGQGTIKKAVFTTKQIAEIIPLTKGEQRNSLLEIQSIHHQFIGAVALERRDYRKVFTYTDQAVRYGEYIENDALISSALLRRAMARYGYYMSYNEQHYLTAAIQDIDTALQHVNRLPLHIKGTVLQNAGMIHAHSIQTSTDITSALKLLDRAGQIARYSDLGEDDYFLKFNLGMHHIRRAIALIAVGRSSEQMKKSMFNDALEQLDLAEKQTSSTMVRRHALINLFRTQAYCGLGEFLCASKVALEALEIFEQIQSRINIGYITQIYCLLCASNYRNAPLVLRLGWKLKNLGELS